MKLALPTPVVLGPYVPHDDPTISVCEAEESDPSFLVGGVLLREGIGGAVGSGPEAGVEGLVGVADQGGVRVGILHQGRRGGKL